MSACARLPEPPRGLVIVTLDTTRADRLPAYGASGIPTPALDRLAREGVVFDRALTVAPLTLTAHTSLFTGLYPGHHGVRDNADSPLDAAQATLAQLLHARGFRTAAFVGSSVLAADRGLARGFDRYSDGSGAASAPPRRRPATEVIDEARTWIDGLDGSPFFLWVHLYDVHTPQTPPLEYRRASGGDPYDAAIAYVDAQLDRLLAELDRTHRLSTTAVVVAGDHGESLGEHGEQEHGIFVYDSVLHVPLIVRTPGIRLAGSAELASLVDVLPTVLDLFHLAPVPADGLSLVPALTGQAIPRDRVVYAESMYGRRFGWSPLRAIRDDQFKYIEAPRPELYDLDADPFEEHDLSRVQTGRVEVMRARLAEFVSGEKSPADQGSSLSADARSAARFTWISQQRPRRRGLTERSKGSHRRVPGR